MQHERSAPTVPVSPRRIKVKDRRGIYFRQTPKGRRYEITFRDSTGRQRWKAIPGHDNLKDAEAALDEVRGKLRRGERVAPARITFAQAVDLWRPTLAGLRPRTRDAYERSLRVHLLDEFGRMRLADITEDHVAGFIDRLRREDYAGWTIRARLVVLGRVFSYAVRRGIVSANPVKGLERGERPTVNRAEMRILDRGEIAKVLAAAEPDRRALLATAMFTGLRLGELLGLAWADVDVDAGLVRVRRQLDRESRERVEPKTRQAIRDVILMPALGRILREHRVASPYAADSDFVFASGIGGGLDQTVARAALARALDAAGLDGRRELGRFLRSRRARLEPEDVGLPSFGLRRVPGLRREELARLVGVDIEYYVRLEQGRAGRPSEDVRDTLARALRLDDAGRAHLYAVGGDGPGVRFHDLRHTFASLLIAQGGNVVFISRQLGHASPDITLKVYAHLFDAAEHAERASAALEQGFGAVLDGNGLETAGDNGRVAVEESARSKVAFLSEVASGGRR